MLSIRRLPIASFTLYTNCYLYQYLPDFHFLELSLTFLVALDSLEQIAIICQFHHDANLCFSDTKPYHRELLDSSTNASLYALTHGCFTDANILTSFIAFYFSFSPRLLIFTFFIAYSFPLSFLLA